MNFDPFLVPLVVMMASFITSLKTIDDLSSRSDPSSSALTFQDIKETASRETLLSQWIGGLIPSPLAQNYQVHNVTAPGIKFFFPLYFILETFSDNRSTIVDTNRLEAIVRTVNQILSKIGVLTFIIGVGQVPPLPFPANLKEIDIKILEVNNRLQDIWRNYPSALLWMVHIFLHQRTEPVPVPVDNFCHWQTSVINLMSDQNRSLENQIWVHIAHFMGLCYLQTFGRNKGRRPSCDQENPAYFLRRPLDGWPEDLFHPALEEVGIRDGHADAGECIGQSPEVVYFSVCGNGLREDNEYCDCMNTTQCPSDCDATTCTQTLDSPKQKRKPVLTIGFFTIFLIMAFLAFCFALYKFYKSHTHHSAFMTIPTDNITELHVQRPPKPFSQSPVLMTFKQRQSSILPTKPLSKVRSRSRPISKERRVVTFHTGKLPRSLSPFTGSGKSRGPQTIGSSPKSQKKAPLERVKGETEITQPRQRTLKTTEFSYRTKFSQTTRESIRSKHRTMSAESKRQMDETKSSESKGKE